MSDVFISYARSSEKQAGQVEEALRSAGFGVWRDAELPAHRSYAEVIEERLRSAKAVVVLWSAEAAKSHWVRAEADAAREAGTLVQAGVDGTIPPMPFNQIQCADLSAWDGSSEHPGWQKLEASVSTLAGTKSKPAESRRSHKRAICICVLPFANMSGDSEQEYFSDGISEDITTDLSKVSALGVIARNTAFTFKGQAVDVCDVARKLGVSHVLEGSVRKAGTRIRITAQLIDGETGDHVWADRFDRDLDDIFAIQDEISKAIVAALKVKLLPEEKKAIEQRGTTNVEAYKLYLLARQYWVTGKEITLGRYATICFGVTAFITLALAFRGAPLILALMMGMFFGIGGPHFVIGKLIKRRVAKFNSNFPDAIELMVRGLRSGLPITETLGIVAGEIPGPVGIEFRMVSDKMKIGRTMEAALQDTADRLGTPEFQFFVITLAIQRETGGNLAETLSNLADVLRKRAQMKLKIRAMSSESKASAYIVGSLPFVVFTLVWMINPAYMQGFFTDQRLMVAGLGGMVWMGIGAFIMAKMVNFEI
jgi:Flp pilus assembly protein TadB